MIKLTRLDGEPFVLNAELIRYVEARPDTFITLTTGERIVVTQTMDEVVTRAISYQQQKHWMPVPHAALAALATATSTPSSSLGNAPSF
ncbi:MAG: flagellar FlbD family protein [Planctomycetaceae bacterium]